MFCCLIGFVMQTSKHHGITFVGPLLTTGITLYIYIYIYSSSFYLKAVFFPLVSSIMHHSHGLTKPPKMKQLP